MQRGKAQHLEPLLVELPQFIIWGIADMNISLKQLIPALISIGVRTENIYAAINELQNLLVELDEVEVKGRTNVDTLLGCMMAIEAIVGDRKDGENNS